MSRGSKEIFDTLEKEFDDVSMCNCLGRCRKGPNVLVDENKILHYTKPRTVIDQVKHGEGEEFVRYNEENIDLEGDYLGDLK